MNRQTPAEIYEIRLKGHLAESWASWFAGMTVTLTEAGDTSIIGPVADQAALHGLLKKVRDLGMPLLSVGHVAAGTVDESKVNHTITKENLR